VTLRLRQLSLTVAATLASAGAVAAAVSSPEPGDMAIGSDKAPVTIVEYASVGCPHCAEWDRTVFPKLQATLIATGRARYVMREMINGNPTVATGGFMIARCAGPTKYFSVVEALFRRQDELFAPGKAGDVLQNVASTAGGLDETAFDACISDQKGLDALNTRISQHMNVDKIDTTPTFVVGGQTLVGDQTLDQLTKAVAAARHQR
jgi:protein-disulfide isomerase